MEDGEGGGLAVREDVGEEGFDANVDSVICFEMKKMVRMMERECYNLCSKKKNSKLTTQTSRL